MSKIGKKEITFWNKLIMKKKNFCRFTRLYILSPFGMKKIDIPISINIIIDNDNLKIILKKNYLIKDDLVNEKLGLYRMKLFNLLQDISNIFIIKLKLVGVGFKVNITFLNNKQYLILSLGYSHKVYIKVPINIYVIKLKKLLKQKIFLVYGLDREKVYEFSEYIRTHKLIDKYKGKGILYLNEVIKIKEGKKQNQV